MTRLARSREICLMMRGLAALFYPGLSVEPLVNADDEVQLSRNRQLSSLPPATQEQRRREYRETVHLRLRLLRRNVFGSFGILASAVFVGWAASWLGAVPSAPVRRELAAASVFCFAWSTLGRLGWAGQSWHGDTVVERVDARIFKFLYWLGTALGTFAIV